MYVLVRTWKRLYMLPLKDRTAIKFIHTSLKLTAVCCAATLVPFLVFLKPSLPAECTARICPISI